MLLRSSRASWIAWPLLLLAAACSKRNLDVGDGMLGLDGGGGGGGGHPSGSTDGGQSDGLGAGGRPPLGGSGGGVVRPDAAESGCVKTAIPLPWTKTASTRLRLAVVTSTDAVAVMNRLDDRLDVRTFAFDGTALGGFQFQADGQLVAYHDDRFLLVARGTTGDFAATSVGRSLMGGTRVSMATATATEHMLAAIATPTNVFLLTDENFVSFASGGGVPWSGILGASDKDVFKVGRVLGLAAQSDRVLIALGGSIDLRLATVTAGGALAAQAQVTSFFADLGSQNAVAFPAFGGMLLFSGNPVRMTELGFDLSRQTLDVNTQLRTFYRVTPQVALIDMAGQPVAFWQTVFPGTDATQGATTHQLYGCTLDFASPGNCGSTSLIADTGLDGYSVPSAPVVAAGLPGGVGFAIAHSDADGQSWLRIADLSCAVPGVPPTP
jgi:hypothetical protein